VHEPSQSYAAMTIEEGATPIQAPMAGCFAQGTENGEDYCMQIDRLYRLRAAPGRLNGPAGQL
jgi:hypothetical protein